MRDHREGSSLAVFSVSVLWPARDISPSLRLFCRDSFFSRLFE